LSSKELLVLHNSHVIFFKMLEYLQDQDQDFKFVLKDSLRTRTRTRTTILLTGTGQGATTFRKFWAHRPIGAKWGVRIPRSRSFFCHQNQTTFRQLYNGRVSPNLAAKRESMYPRNISEGVFENLPFRGHLPSKTSKLKGIKQAH